MTRIRWIAMVLVAVVAFGCSTGEIATPMPSTRPSAPPQPAASPSTRPSLGQVAAPSTGPSPRPVTSRSPVAGCPLQPTLVDLVELDRDPGPLTIAFRPIYGHHSEAAMACYGDTELRFVAFIAAPEGLGGVDRFVIEPRWLTARGYWLAADDSKEQEGFYSGPFLAVAVRPADEAAFDLLRGGWADIRGHFSDPVATSCRVIEGRPPTAPTTQQAITICRTAFVVTATQPVPPPQSD